MRPHMSRKHAFKTTSATLALLGMLTNTVAVGAEPKLTLATSDDTLGAQYGRFPKDQTKLTLQQKIALLHTKVKYVFVLFQENRSFDVYFGTYPGANGLFSTFTKADPTDPLAQPGNQTGSFSQNIRNTDGSYSTITPFLVPRTITDVNGAPVSLYPESIYSVDHSHTGYINDLHADLATKSATKNDGYALDQEGLAYSGDASTIATVVSTATHMPPTSNPSLSTKQKGEIVMAHVDCDTIPVPVAFRRRRHVVRQSSPGHHRPVLAERDRDDFGAERRHAMGAASGHDRKQHNRLYGAERDRQRAVRRQRERHLCRQAALWPRRSQLRDLRGGQHRRRRGLLQ